MPSNNVNDGLNITGTTMTIDADEDAVKVDNDERYFGRNHVSFNNKMTITAGRRRNPYFWRSDHR